MARWQGQHDQGVQRMIKNSKRIIWQAGTLMRRVTSTPPSRTTRATRGPRLTAHWSEDFEQVLRDLARHVCGVCLMDRLSLAWRDQIESEVAHDGHVLGAVTHAQA